MNKKIEENAPSKIYHLFEYYKNEDNQDDKFITSFGTTLYFDGYHHIREINGGQDITELYSSKTMMYGDVKKYDSKLQVANVINNLQLTEDNNIMYDGFEFNEEYSKEIADEIEAVLEKYINKLYQT